MSQLSNKPCRLAILYTPTFLRNIFILFVPYVVVEYNDELFADLKVIWIFNIIDIFNYIFIGWVYGFKNLISSTIDILTNGISHTIHYYDVYYS